MPAYTKCTNSYRSTFYMEIWLLCKDTVLQEGLHVHDVQVVDPIMVSSFPISHKYTHDYIEASVHQLCKFLHAIPVS